MFFHPVIIRGRMIAPDHFRVVFLPNVDDLREAIGRIGKFLEHYRKRHGG